MLRPPRLLWMCLLPSFLACGDGDSGGEPGPREVAGRYADVARDPSAPIQTDTTFYRLVRDGIGWRADVPFVFRNTSPYTLHAINCNGALTVAVERRTESGWTTFWAPITDGCMSPPVAIPPGDTLRLPLTIWGAPPGSDTGPQFVDTTFAGRYRLVWWNLVSARGDTVPVRLRSSNEFLMRSD